MHRHKEAGEEAGDVGDGQEFIRSRVQGDDQARQVWGLGQALHRRGGSLGGSEVKAGGRVALTQNVHLSEFRLPIMPAILGGVTRE